MNGPRHARRQALSVVSVFCAGVLLAACGSGTTKSSSGSSGATTAGSGAAAASSAAGTSAANTITVDGIAFPKPEKTELSVGEPAIDIGSMPMYLAQDAGIAKKWGIDFKLKTFGSDAQATQALVAGQIDVVDSSQGSLTTQGSPNPAQITYVTSQTVSDLLVGGKNVTDAASLKGKSIAVSSFGSFSYAEALLSLQSLGLTAKDVTLTAVGHDSDRLAALTSGGVGASIQDHQLGAELTSKGYHVLVDLGHVKTPGYVGTALTVPVSFQKKYPNTTLALTAIYQEGVYDFLHDSLGVNDKVWAKESGEPLAKATADVKDELAIPWVPLDGHCDVATFAFMKQVQQVTNPKMASVDPNKACTNEFVDKLKAMGFQKKLGVPGY